MLALVIGLLLAVLRIAVLPLAAADTGLPYGLLPSPGDLQAMTRQLRAGLAADGMSVMDAQTVARAVRVTGFSQAVPNRACAAAECARKIGRQLHADSVVFGSVTRQMAVVWGSRLSMIDVRTGKLVEMNVGYKGDVQAMELGLHYAGECVGRVLSGRRPCPPDPGW